MALTEFQRTVCRLISSSRIEQGESYIAGGTALNAFTGGSRISQDIDSFHDTEEALELTWDVDRKILQSEFSVDLIRERAGYVEAVISRGSDSVVMQWARDSAYRFFPLVEHDDFGLTLHPFDLATNKVLALVGRLEVRDWVDVITCDRSIQPMGYLAWAACGKDPGFCPTMILEHAARSSHYSAEEVSELSFDGSPPDAGNLARAWHQILQDSNEVVASLPAVDVGRCAMTSDGELYKGKASQISTDLAAGVLQFHSGRIKGAYPSIVERAD
jgi:hypothetical protein